MVVAEEGVEVAGWGGGAAFDVVGCFGVGGVLFVVGVGVGGGAGLGCCLQWLVPR